MPPRAELLRITIVHNLAILVGVLLIPGALLRLYGNWHHGPIGAVLEFLIEEAIGFVLIVWGRT